MQKVIVNGRKIKLKKDTRIGMIQINIICSKHAIYRHNRIYKPLGLNY